MVSKKISFQVGLPIQRIGRWTNDNKEMVFTSDDAIRAVIIEPQKDPRVILLQRPVEASLQSVLRWDDIIGFSGNNISLFVADRGLDHDLLPNVLFVVAPEITPRSRWKILYGSVVAVQTRDILDDDGTSELVSLSDDNLTWVMRTYSLTGDYRV